MKIFILTKIGDNIFFEDEIVKKFLLDFKIGLNYSKIGCIYGYFGELNQNDFLIILPILNGLFGKYYFFNELINDYISFGKNIINFEYDEKNIKNNSIKIGNINIELNSNKLITNSKKEQYKIDILNGLYDIGGFLIKTFFLIEEMISNKEDLQKIINDPKGLIEFKTQAKLLDKVTFDKLDLIKIRFDFLNLELENYSIILYKYFKNYVK